jgi:hypothetical protein
MRRMQANHRVNAYAAVTARRRSVRPLPGGVVAMPAWFRPVASADGSQPFNGMDPSDPSTYTRPWNPQPGMIAYLNFDGAQVQGNTEMGGLWGAPARADSPVGKRPARRPR